MNREFAADAIAEIKGLPDVNQAFSRMQTCEAQPYFSASDDAKSTFIGAAEWCGVALTQQQRNTEHNVCARHSPMHNPLGSIAHVL